MSDDMPTVEATWVEPDGCWAYGKAHGLDGYSIRPWVEQFGWRPIGAWGRDGRPIASWPVSEVFWCEKDGHFDLALYAGSDVVQFEFPTEEMRTLATDGIAFYYWKSRNEPWVQGIDTAEQMPSYLRGPYSEERWGGVEPLRVLYRELGDMLADVEENYTDMHPADVAEVLRNCKLTALRLAEEIEARRTWVLEEVLPDWELTDSGKDAGMSPASGESMQPPTMPPPTDNAGGYEVG